MDYSNMINENPYGVPLPCLDTPPLPLWMTEPTELHDLPFQPFYLSLSASTVGSPSPSTSSSSSSLASSSSTSRPTAPARTSSLRSRTRSSRPKLASHASCPSEDSLSTAFWSTVEAESLSSALLSSQRAHTRQELRAKYGQAADMWWGAREAQVTWDTQDSRRSVLWFETAPGSGVWESREKPITKKNVTRSERRREEKEKSGEMVPSQCTTTAVLSPRKRTRTRPAPASVEGEAGPSRRSARNNILKSPAPAFSPSARLSPLGDTPDLDSQMLSLPASASASVSPSPASSLTSLPTDTTPSTPAFQLCPLTLLTNALFSSPISSSGSSTAVSPTASEHALDLGRARSGSTASAGTAVDGDGDGESEVAKGKRKRFDEDDGAEEGGVNEGDDDAQENGLDAENAAAVRRTTRARLRTSKAQSQASIEAKATGSGAPPRKRRKARGRA
ncbi:hypothetical protein FIBSPDRAFT_846273 [Athelia psychrophila]|uniref:Uncharacterized protein n=1 Tax=Athelia psychrophila TaxID=1759441 RepID=A0A166WW30_9AGAM|nr:hypothetical protein FIBSPDRAFT_846273 [Fibularhizoctonia sp. CBS 109695]